MSSYAGSSPSKQWSTESQFVSYVVTGAIVLVALILRVVSRLRMKISLGWDDYLSLAAGLIFLYNNAWGAWDIMVGLYTPNPYDLPPQWIELQLLCFYISELLGVACFSFAKLSVFCLYLRIFGVDRRFRRTVHIFIVVATIEFIVIFLVDALQCMPVEAAWRPGLQNEAKCMSTEVIAFATNILNILWEILVIFLPINLIRKLNLQLRQRVGISLIFLVGTFAVVATIVRLASSTSLNEPSYASIETAIWVNIQLCTVIVTGCLLTYRGLLPDRLVNWISTIFASIVPSRWSSRSRGRWSQSPSRTNENQIETTVNGPMKWIRKFSSTSNIHQGVHHSVEIRELRVPQNTVRTEHSSQDDSALV